MDHGVVRENSQPHGLTETLPAVPRLRASGNITVRFPVAGSSNTRSASATPVNPMTPFGCPYLTTLHTTSNLLYCHCIPPEANARTRPWLYQIKSNANLYSAVGQYDRNRNRSAGAGTGLDRLYVKQVTLKTRNTAVMSQIVPDA